MTDRKYDSRESLNRIYRSLIGSVNPSDVPGGVSGEIHSEDEILSLVAELTENKLAGQTGQVPAGWTVGGQVEYGEIYNNSTGTAVVALSTSWAKVTGSFQGETVSSDNIAPDWQNDHITINKAGVYFVGMMLSFSGGANATINAAAYVGGVRSESVRFRRKLGSVGDVGSAASLGIINVSSVPADIEVYAMADLGTPNFKLEAGQLFVYGVS